MNYDRIYQYRFQDIAADKKKITWEEIANFIYNQLSKPAVILDPAAGKCEFINAVKSEERWAVDLNDYFIGKYADPAINIVVGDIFKVDLPENHFDAIFVSNFLEHLDSQYQVAEFLEKMFTCMKPGGKIAVMGPNFKYASRSYFDFADHTVILSELGLAEHLYGAGFEIDRIHPRFLPLSFRGRIPVSRRLVKMYLSLPFAWRILGKQFLLIATKAKPVVDAVTA
jgi:SAM-dependent methyltransferase